MSFSILDRHPVIGWDFDETLWGHPHSEEMHAYILAHPEKKHYIVTFRTHGLLRALWIDLQDYEEAPPGMAFEDVLSVPPEIWMRFQDVKDKADHPDHLAYIEWKGMICAKHGITVLVDDKVEHTLDGCTKYGIQFINPDDF